MEAEVLTALTEVSVSFGVSLGRAVFVGTWNAGDTSLGLAGTAGGSGLGERGMPSFSG